MMAGNRYGIPEDAVITVAGMVGVGKSTMTKALAKALNFKTSLEKVDNNPYLENFYEDFDRWSFHLQVYFLAERFKEQMKIYQYGGGYVQDRSIYEDTGIFARMHYENGTMNPTDYETYKNLFEAMVMTPYFPHPDLLIYIEGPLDTVVKRIHERGREMEQNTPISYWEEMHERYRTWIDRFDACPVLRLDMSDYDLFGDVRAVERILDKAASVIGRGKDVPDGR